MSERGRDLFHWIPILLHLNHSELPGYCSAQSTPPYGIAQFTLNAAQQRLLAVNYPNVFSALFLSPTDEWLSPQILGLYTMGSTSSMGQSLSSDLDVWVCIDVSMPSHERDLLHNKCQAISEWAKQQGIEVNFFLMDEQRFRHQQSDEMTGENCGSSQHLLLLDEFYRSAVRLAGKRLLWQVVPPEMEERYDEYLSELCQQEDIHCQDWIDFGRLTCIPAEEYFGANLWQLYKSIDSPYKSVLKAILLEAYAWEYPHTQLLSSTAKHRFFAEESDLDSMDSYWLMLEKVTDYLEQTGDQARLELVRRCFYLKTHEKLSREPNPTSVIWRRNALHSMVKAWNWNDDLLKELDHRRYWKVEQVKIVHHALLGALMESYRQLIQFARRNDIISAISPQDIAILARKLYAAFEVLPGKVTLLNPQISPNLHEDALTFIQVAPGQVNTAGWYLYKQPPEPKRMISQRHLEQNEYLSKLVAWAFFNGLITESTRLYSVSNTQQLDIDTFYQMVSDLRNTFSLNKHRPTLAALASPCEISQLAIFINFEKDPTAQVQHKQTKIDRQQADIFSFGVDQQCLVGSIDLVYRNSWQEVRTLHFEGETAMLDALKTILGKMHQDALPPQSIDVFCYSKQLRTSISNLVYQLLIECIDLRLKPVESGRYRRFKALRIGKQVYGLFFERRGVSVQRLENSVEFYRCISTNKLTGSPVVMLEEEQQHLPEVIDAFASEGLVQFFFEDIAQGFTIYILDEHNKAEVYHQLSGDKDEVIANINNLYTSGMDDVQSLTSSHFNLPQYYQVIRPEQGESYVVPYRSNSVMNTKPSRLVNAS